MKAYRAQERLRAIQAYGGEHPKCSCPGCQESRVEFLSIDHINGGGTKHRKELRNNQKRTKNDIKDCGLYDPGGGVLFRWLRKNGYPPGYRVLCYNCNASRANGPCPIHEVQGKKDPTTREIRKKIIEKLLKSGKITIL
jgi:hypothetical protein